MNIIEIRTCLPVVGGTGGCLFMPKNLTTWKKDFLKATEETEEAAMIVNNLGFGTGEAFIFFVNGNEYEMPNTHKESENFGFAVNKETLTKMIESLQIVLDNFNN